LVNKKRIIAIIILPIVLFSAFAHTEADTPVLNNSNDLLHSVIPIEYGRDSFVQRIDERTQGKREPVGLVLSGGSARAFAHIGVIKYLEEKGISPDFIVSNSMGSIVGIMYAAGLSSDQILEISESLSVSSLFDITFPVAGGILDNTKFISFLTSYIEEGVQLEDLQIPIMVVAEDAATKRQVHIMEGDISKALSASFAIPVYFPPVKINGHMLIDGGITNIVPLDIAYEYSSTVIVSTTFYEGSGINLRNSLSVLNIALDIGKRRSGVQSILDHPDAIWIRCDVEDFSFMDFDAVDDLSQRGYESAKKKDDELSMLVDNQSELDFVPSKEFDVIHQEILNNYYLYNDVVPDFSSHQLFFGLKNFAFQKDSQNLLRDETVLGLRYTYSISRFTFSTLTGVAIQSSVVDYNYPEIQLSSTYTIADSTKITGEFVTSFDQGMVPSSYLMANGRTRQQFLSRRFILEEFVRYEIQYTESYASKENLFETGIASWFRGPSSYPAKVNNIISYQATDSFSRHFINTHVDLLLPLPRDFSLSGSYVGRFALDGNGDFPFFRSDGFLSIDDDLIMLGRNNLTHNNANHLMVGVVNFDWSPSSFKPTIGELVIMKDSSMGIFGQFLWFEKMQTSPYMILGARFSSTVSLLGLKELPTSLYLGYDSLSRSFLAQLQFGIGTWN